MIASLHFFTNVPIKIVTIGQYITITCSEWPVIFFWFTVQFVLKVAAALTSWQVTASSTKGTQASVRSSSDANTCKAREMNSDDSARATCNRWPMLRERKKPRTHLTTNTLLASEIYDKIPVGQNFPDHISLFDNVPICCKTFTSYGFFFAF